MIFTFTHENFMLKGRVDTHTDTECCRIHIDHTFNPMSESKRLESLHPESDGNVDVTPNGKPKEKHVRSYEGSGGKRSFGVLTDEADGRSPKRNSKDFAQEQSSMSHFEESSRESYGSMDSGRLSLGQLKPGYNDLQPGNKNALKPKQFMKFTKGLFTKGASTTPGTSPKHNSKTPSPSEENVLDKFSPNGQRPNKTFATGISAKKQESKVRFFNRKRRNRNKLICNAGSSLWSPLGECAWVAASGRRFALRNTTLFDLCESERSVLQQILLQKLTELQLGCNISPPKDGGSARRTWKQRLFLGRKEKDTKEARNFGVALSQVIANDLEAEEVANRAAMFRNRDRSMTHEEEIAKDLTEVDTSIIDGDVLNKRNSLPSSYTPLMRSNSVNFDEAEEIDFSTDNINERQEPVTVPRLRSDFRRNCENHRRSRLLDALTLSSTSASYVSIIDRDDELKPAPPRVPSIVLTLIDYIEKNGLNLLGIFRTGGLKKRVRQMREELDRGNTAVIESEETNPQDVAALLKGFFRDLPDPLLTRELYTPFLATRKLNDPVKQLIALQMLIALLPVASRDTLSALLTLLGKVASFAQDTVDEEGNVIPGNKMDSRNLATLIGPNILHRVKANASAQTFSQEDSLRLAEENNEMIDVVKEMIESHKELFKVSAGLHDEVLRSLLDTEPEIVDYVLRKKASRISQMDFPDDIQEELTRLPDTSNMQHQRSMTLDTSQRPKFASRYSDEGSLTRNSMRAQNASSASNAMRQGSIRSTASEPDHFNSRKSNSSFNSHNASSSLRNRYETYKHYPESEPMSDLDNNRVSYRDSGVGLGRNSHCFSMEETRRKISALESLPIHQSPTPSSETSSKSSTSYSSPASTPILERTDEDNKSVKFRQREIRECRDSAYASGRFSRKGGSTYQGMPAFFAVGEEDASPNPSVSSQSPRSPRSPMLSEILDEPSFSNNNVGWRARKSSLPMESPGDRGSGQRRPPEFARSLSTATEHPTNQQVETNIRKAFLTWEEATWPHWDRNATDNDMPDQETIL